ncbi:MAG: hypothetical protein KI790_12955 [Cyclobacteriaceae bacterium]|nr:hypothetical protein [Cyclobacteriaceae bacterium HetDA_MAG_MS6]
MPKVLLINKLIDKITEYLKLKGDQVKVEAMGHVARVLSVVITYGIIAFIGGFLLFFLSITVAVCLNHLLESTFLGYLIMSGLLFLLVIVLLLVHKTGSLQRWLEGLILGIGDPKEKDEEDHE